MRTEKPGQPRGAASSWHAGVGASVPAAMSSTVPQRSHTAWWCGADVRIEPRRIAPLPGRRTVPREAGARQRVERVVDGREAHRRKASAGGARRDLRRRVRRRRPRRAARWRCAAGSSFNPARFRSREHRARGLRVLGIHEVAKLTRIVPRCNPLQIGGGRPSGRVTYRKLPAPAQSLRLRPPSTASLK